MIHAQTGSGLLADMQAYSAAYLPVLDAVTDSKILQATINIPVVLPGGLKAGPVAMSQNANAALMDFVSAAGPQKVGLSLPNFIPAGYLTTVPTVVDDTQASVAAFIAFLTTLSSTTRATDEDFINLTAFRSGEIGTRKHRRQVARAKLAP
jgi:hypothetical protein